MAELELLDVGSAPLAASTAGGQVGDASRVTPKTGGRKRTKRQTIAKDKDGAAQGHRLEGEKVSAQQLVERHWIDPPSAEDMRQHEQRWSDFWFVTDNPPSRAEVAAQLRKLRGDKRPGTLQSATKTNESAVKKSRAAGKKWVVGKPPNSGAYRHLVGDGAADSEWRQKLQGGLPLPAPFSVGGDTGRQADYTISAVRE
jgi:hypothetical protein